MKKKYVVKTITGPHLRLNRTGETEKYYVVKAESAEGVPFDLEALDTNMDAKTIDPLLSEKAARLDSVKVLGGD